MGIDADQCSPITPEIRLFTALVSVSLDRGILRVHQQPRTCRPVHSPDAVTAWPVWGFSDPCRATEPRIRATMRPAEVDRSSSAPCTVRSMPRTGDRPVDAKRLGRGTGFFELGERLSGKPVWPATGRFPGAEPRVHGADVVVELCEPACPDDGVRRLASCVARATRPTCGAIGLRSRRPDASPPRRRKTSRTCSRRSAEPAAVVVRSLPG